MLELWTAARYNSSIKSFEVPDMTDAKQKSAAKAFAEYWKDKGYENGESQAFWLSLLREIFGVSEPEKLIRFEDQVKLDKSTRMNASYSKKYRQYVRHEDGDLGC